MKMKMIRFKPSALEVLIFIAGVVLGGLLTEWATVKEVKLAETVSALFTALGVIYAFYMAKNWMRTKEQDDKYLAAKRVINALATAEWELNGYSISIVPFIPLPGNRELSESEMENIIRQCQEYERNWKDSIRDLNVAIAELRMYGVKIKPENEQFHQEINQAAYSVGVYLSCLENDMRNHLGARQQREGFNHPGFGGDDLRANFNHLHAGAQHFFSLTKTRLQQPIRDFFQF